MKYLSVCSGIEAATVAWHPLGWQPQAFSEIDKFPSAVLAHHYPTVPNLGDMNDHARWPGLAPDLLVGGTPCQSFSVAGLRRGMADPRGNLALVFLSLVDQCRPRWVVWENVPGVRSSGRGRDFGAFLGALGQLGYGWAYRSLDAQYHGLAQRRERVFVVGYLGDWRPPAAVLFEPEGLRGDSAPRREAREDVASCLGASPACSSSPNVANGQGTVVAGTVTAKWAKGTGGYAGQNEADNLVFVTDPAGHDVCGTLSDGAHHGGGLNGQDAYTGRILPMTVCADVAPAIPASGAGTSRTGNERTEADFLVATGPALAFDTYNLAANRETSQTLSSSASDVNHVGAVLSQGSRMVRRLTPRECERLQGFPDDYTLIPYGRGLSKDGPRYKALGNSMAVPVMARIGRMIQLVEEGR